ICHQFCGEVRTVPRFFVRRVRKDNIKHFSGGSAPEEIEDVLLMNPPLQPCFGEIALDDLSRLSIYFDKNSRGRAAAKRFNSQCAASCEKIEHTRTHYGISQTGKDCSFDAVHCWSHTAFWNCQADSAGTAGDHSHGDEAGVGVAAPSGKASSGGAEVAGAPGTTLPPSLP